MLGSLRLAGAISVRTASCTVRLPTVFLFPNKHCGAIIMCIHPKHQYNNITTSQLAWFSIFVVPLMIFLGLLAASFFSYLLSPIFILLFSTSFSLVNLNVLIFTVWHKAIVGTEEVVYIGRHYSAARQPRMTKTTLLFQTSPSDAVLSPQVPVLMSIHI